MLYRSQRGQVNRPRCSFASGAVFTLWCFECYNFLMSDKLPHGEKPNSGETLAPELRRQDDAGFAAEIENLIQESEALRLRRMQQHRSRGFMSMTLGIFSIVIGAGAFGWFLLVMADIALAVLSMMLAVALPAFLHFWAERPIQLYVLDHKREFMPKMAKVLGGLNFYPKRGISAEILAKTGVLPSHDAYSAEDCFMGKYRGVKVMFSEARLSSRRQKGGSVFSGVFVLLETSSKLIEGHTIITADPEMVKRYAGTRWKELQNVNIKTDNPDWGRFQVFSSNPESASLLVGERLLKELSEAADIFDNAPLTAVLFRGKYIFIMIPYARDMFEASNVYVPVTTKQHALQCKKEIEQLLEIIDVFDLYEPGEGARPFAT